MGRKKAHVGTKWALNVKDISLKENKAHKGIRSVQLAANGAPL